MASRRRDDASGRAGWSVARRDSAFVAMIGEFAFYW